MSDRRIIASILSVLLPQLAEVVWLLLLRSS
jgi:hypothetical protein